MRRQGSPSSVTTIMCLDCWTRQGLGQTQTQTPTDVAREKQQQPCQRGEATAVAAAEAAACHCRGVLAVRTLPNRTRYS
jgi:hypothetical protein